MCSNTKADGQPYDTLETFSAHCPNCASRHDPTQVDSAPEVGNPEWGRMQPRMTSVDEGHRGKFVSHFGTTRMHFKNAADVLRQGQGIITVDRHQELDAKGVVQDYFQFSFDHGNRMGC